MRLRKYKGFDDLLRAGKRRAAALAPIRGPVAQAATRPRVAVRCPAGHAQVGQCLAQQNAGRPPARALRAHLRPTVHPTVTSSGQKHTDWRVGMRIALHNTGRSASPLSPGTRAPLEGCTETALVRRCPRTHRVQLHPPPKPLSAIHVGSAMLHPATVGRLVRLAATLL